MSLGQTVFLSHGGGPLPLLGDPGHKELVEHLTSLTKNLTKPKAIVIFSAHWESDLIEITQTETPDLIYDYYGFPPESYHIQYPVSGATQLAQSIFEHLEAANIKAKLNQERGLDHGVFVPLKIMYPDADIPCIQVSLSSTLDSKRHINIGQALQPLLSEDILFIGSGFSFHNLKAFFSQETPESKQANLDFETWLQSTLSDKQLSEKQRESKLINWTDAPYARYCHPREEHLLPLHICYGINQTACKQAHTVNVLNKQASSFIW